MIFDWNMAKKVNVIRVTAQRHASMYGYCNRYNCSMSFIINIVLSCELTIFSFCSF